MPHRSRLTAVLVDVTGDAHDRAATFWSAALGRERKPIDQHPEYTFLGQPTPGVEFMVQALGDGGDPPRVHLDIETDDVDAEVERLVGLGAVVIERVQTWVVMRDPVGTVFCVVRVQVPEMFEQHATRWDD
jgi:predicted enzyme related to lactoylglutathione lyase